MTNAGYWIIGLVAVFMFGTFMSARISPREKALGNMRERAKKMAFIPRLIPAPLWIEHTTYSGKPGGMVAYYSIVLSDAKHALVQALVVDGHLNVLKGEPILQGEPIGSNLKGIQALEIQSNSAGFYWDEEADLSGEQLESMKNALISFADRMKPPVRSFTSVD